MQAHTPRKHKFKRSLQENSRKRAIVILEGAYLEAAKSKKGNYELLNSDDHATLLKKLNRDWTEARPDITHQCLLTLLDSPLSKAGLLDVYVHTKKNVLIEINPQTRIPRTFKRFSGLMTQLLHENKIQSIAEEGSKTLMKVIKNPVTQHLPIGIRIIGCSTEGSPTSLKSFSATVDASQPIAFIVGAYAKGKDFFPYAEEHISISSYPLSASVVCSKIANCMEDLWDVT
ncbi:ribosomal RNA small subunit methyltransferase NEP1-like [Schistocerca gregaria]|uniref:ribosomal RNA small subunit methyltransferase NEP1-like n=1 Tax=Schistocerca gregaria TaxID=7010 RepID=UPI00211E91A8|nr:ribosomal RNA small subunit methyltransferase NEP1-like [Schistocerca gregaria]